MYWDILEVRAMGNHSLWLRFADGVTGTVQLNAAEFTGELTPLRDQNFFDQVGLEHGAPSWRGEIDLAPDELYRELQKVEAGSEPVCLEGSVGAPP